MGRRLALGTISMRERTPSPDPVVEQIIAEKQREAGVNPRTVERDEIFERLFYPMINEGARILEEGIATRASDIDIIWINGYGWPVWTGGPMFYADTVGLKHIAERLAFYAEQTGDETLRPAALLQRLADAGEGFSAVAKKAA